MKKLLFVFPIVVLLAAGCTSSYQVSTNPGPTPVTQNINPTTAPTPTESPAAVPTQAPKNTSIKTLTAPIIDSINPASGPADKTIITISGAGFTSIDNSVYLSASSYFGTSKDFGLLVAKLNSADNKTLQFTIPSSIPSGGGNSLINPGTYTITVVNSNGASNHKTFTVTASMANSCVINSFTASPLTITSGENATISWDTKNCMNIYISNTGLVTFNKHVDSIGNMTVSPTSATTYSIEAHDVTGTGVIAKSVAVKVNP